MSSPRREAVATGNAGLPGGNWGGGVRGRGDLAFQACDQWTQRSPTLKVSALLSWKF